MSNSSTGNSESHQNDNHFGEQSNKQLTNFESITKSEDLLGSYHHQDATAIDRLASNTFSDLWGNEYLISEIFFVESGIREVNQDASCLPAEAYRFIQHDLVTNKFTSGMKTYHIRGTTTDNNNKAQNQTMKIVISAAPMGPSSFLKLVLPKRQENFLRQFYF